MYCTIHYRFESKLKKQSANSAFDSNLCDLQLNNVLFGTRSFRMSTPGIYRPGQIVPISGIYAEVNRFGGRTGRNAACVLREPFPPTQDNGYGYILIQRSNW
jgi:hypothetical protein